MTDSIRRPELPRGWSWHTRRHTVQQTVNGEERAFPKVFIELIDHIGKTVRHATIDVEMYGDSAAVEERIRNMHTAEFGGDA